MRRGGWEEERVMGRQLGDICVHIWRRLCSPLARNLQEAATRHTHLDAHLQMKGGLCSSAHLGYECAPTLVHIWRLFRAIVHSWETAGFYDSELGCSWCAQLQGLGIVCTHSWMGPWCHSCTHRCRHLCVEVHTHLWRAAYFEFVCIWSHDNV